MSGGRRKRRFSWCIWTTVSSTVRRWCFSQKLKSCLNFPKRDEGASRNLQQSCDGRLKVHLVQVKCEQTCQLLRNLLLLSSWRFCSATLTCICSWLDQESLLLDSRQPATGRGHRWVWFGVRRTGPPISVCTRSVHRGWWPACEKSPSHPEPSPSPGRTGTPGAPGGSPTSANAGGKAKQSSPAQKPTEWFFFYYYFKALIWPISEGDRQDQRPSSQRVITTATARGSHYTVISSAVESRRTHTLSGAQMLLTVKMSVGSLREN